MDIIKIIKENWRYNHAEVVEKYEVGGGRIVCRIHTESADVVLKGIPNTIEEKVIESNTKAHEYLGNKSGLAPSLLNLPDDSLYIHINDYYFYLMTYVDGRQLQETVGDEFLLGKATRQMHQLHDPCEKSSFYSRNKIKEYRSWFKEYDFKEQYNSIVDGLPDFAMYDQCFIHTDIGPHNARYNKDGKVVFVDLDDAGHGPKYLDLGWPFIMQFVDYNKSTGEMKYQFDLAVAFLSGYFDDGNIDKETYNKIWEGATFMHVSYMKTFGPEAVEPLWNILNFGINQKNKLYEMYHSNNNHSCQ